MRRVERRCRLAGHVLSLSLVAMASWPAPGCAREARPAPGNPGACERCGPAPAYPTSECPDGQHLGGRGPCVQLADGTCGWLRATCPAPAGAPRRSACEARECGSPPAVRKWPCPGGERTGEIGACIRGAGGRCGWAYRPCASTKPPPPAPRPPAAIRRSGNARPGEEAARAHPCWKIDRKEILKWPVRELCDPIGHYPPILFGLPDGTNVYRSSDRECFRGRKSPDCRKKCMPAWARIDTPDGPRRIDELRAGALVWSVDASGNRIAAPLVRVGSVEVGSRHELLRILLADGRVVEASWGHPRAAGGLIGELGPGSVLDGSEVVEVRRIRYDGQRTFDILPGGPTGLYFAGGVLLGSSLRDE